MMENSAQKRLTLKEKVSYGLGDVGNGFMFDMGQIYLLKFYTDILGISAYWGGLVFLVSKIFDAFADSSVGAFIDKRKVGKRGKFRPFILFGSIPLAIMTVISFMAPDFSDTGKIAFAFITYMAFGLSYSIVNIPYGSLAASMTQESVDRASLGSFRAIGSQFAMLISGMVVIPIVLYFPDQKLGYTVGIGSMALIGVIFHYICYRNTNENVVRLPKKEEEKVPMSKLFKLLLSNRPLIALCFVCLFMVAGSNLRTAVQLYYLQYNLGNPGLMSLLSFTSIGIAVIGSFFIPALVKRLGKKKTFIIGLLIGIAADVANFVLPANVPTFIILLTIGSLGLSFALGLPWVMVADAVDYHEWKTGQRTEGIVYSSYSFFRKLAQALAGFIPGVALGLIGYVPNAEQTAGTLLGIKGLMFLVPAGLNLIAAVILIVLYNLTEDLYKKIIDELKDKQKVNDNLKSA
jgi:GPH family glycoside/pentoside/hexuronide:cation symporter